MDSDKKENPDLGPFWNFMDEFLDIVESDPDLQAAIEEDNEKMLREAGFYDDESN